MSVGGAIRAGRAFVELFADDSKLVRGLRRARDRFQAWGAGLTRIGGTIFGGAAAAMTPLLAAGKVFAQMGDKLDKASARTGATVEQLSALGYAADMAGSNLELVEAGLRKLQQKLDDAAGGSKQARAAFSALGLSAQQLSRLDAEGQFGAIADALASIDDPAKRTAAAMEIFGKSGAMLIPMLKDGRAGLAAMKAEAERLGLIMSTEDASAAAVFSDAMDRLWKVMKNGVFKVGAALAPLLTSLSNVFTDIAARVAKWINENRRLVVQIFTIASAVAAIGVTLLTAGVGLKVAGLAFGGFATVLATTSKVLLMFGRVAGVVFRILGTGVGTIVKLAGTMLRAAITAVVSGATAGFAAISGGIAAVATPIGVLGVALVGLAALIVQQSGIIGSSIDGMKTLWGELKTDAVTAWGAISTALARGDLAAAAAVAWTGLKLVWARSIAFLQGQWIEFTSFLKSVLNESWSNTSSVIITSIAAISAGWTHTVDFMGDVWSIFTDALAKTWHTTIGFIKKAWVRLKSLFGADIDVDAEVNRINKETDERNAASDAKRDQAVGSRDAERKKRLKEIEDEKNAALAANEEIRNGRNTKIQGEAEKRIADLQAELAKAKADFQEAVTTANTEAKPDGKATEERRKKMRAGVSAVGEFKSAGTFSASAVRSLGNSSETKKQTGHLEAIEQNTKKLLDKDGEEFEP